MRLSYGTKHPHSSRHSVTRLQVHKHILIRRARLVQCFPARTPEGASHVERGWCNGGGSGGGGNGGKGVDSDNGRFWRDGWRGSMLLLLALMRRSACAAPLHATDATVSVIIPALNEEAVIADTVQYCAHGLQPSPIEVIVVNGGSTDRTATVAKSAGARVLHSSKGRALQMNTGAAQAKGDVLFFVHADSRPPENSISVIRRILADPTTVLAAFRTVVEVDGEPLKFITWHHLVKTFYIPVLLRPLSFIRGGRLLFGDQSMFCRAVDFWSVGGFNERLPIMEDADLCIRMHMAGAAGRPAGVRGRIRQVYDPVATTSGRRIAGMGSLKATAVHFIIALSWYFGATTQQMKQLYTSLYPDTAR